MVCLSKSMEEPVFIKCEPAWPSDTEEEFSNSEPNAIPPSDKQVKVEEDQHAAVGDPSPEGVDIKVVKVPPSDEDGMEGAPNEECDISGGSSREVKDATAVIRRAVHCCDNCSKIFKRKSHLRNHMLTHTGERAHCCTICNSTFSRDSHLKAHLLIHSAEKSFLCSVCGNTFISSSHLRIHEKTHTDSKPFSCLICGNTFRRWSDLRYHEVVHTDKRPFSCSLCGKNFRRLSHLKRHQNTHIL